MAAKQTTQGSREAGACKTTFDEHCVAAVDDVEGIACTPNNALSPTPVLLEASTGTADAASIGGMCTEAQRASHFMEYGSSLLGLQRPGFEERQWQNHSERVLLQQQQQQQQQQRVFLEAAASLPSFLPRSQLATDFGGDQLAKLQSTLVARAQLERAHAQLLFQQNRIMRAFHASDSTERQNQIPANLSSHGTGLAASVSEDSKVRRVQSLPFIDQQPSMPKASQEDKADDDADENQDSTSDQAGDPSAAAQDRFPLKLFRLLDEAEQSGNDTIVSFFPHGRAFAVHRPREFVIKLMPKYFTTSRMSSFQRQLNLYGFRRINEGRDKGGYFHKDFLRGRKDLCKKIRRKKKNRHVTRDPVERESSDDVVDISGSAASTDALQQAMLLAQLNSQNEMHFRQHYLPSMLQTFQPTASSTHPIRWPSLLGPAGLLDRSLSAGLGALSHIGASGDADRVHVQHA